MKHYIEANEVPVEIQAKITQEQIENAIDYDTSVSFTDFWDGYLFCVEDNYEAIDKCYIH